jgi:uncharacterized protein YggE
MEVHQTSRTLIALLGVVVVLGSSSAYLAMLVLQPRSPGSPISNQVTQNHSPYAVIGIDPTTTATGSSNSIIVSATGQASYTPNEALIQVSVQTQDSTAQGATQTNALHMAGVIRALNGIGIANSSIQTQSFNLYANYASCYSGPCVPQITGYTVFNSIQVNFTSNSPTTLGLKSGQIIDTAVKAGSNQVSLYFGATQSVIAQLTNQAIKNAVAAADSQAHAIAGSLGVSIKGVISASEGGSPYYPGPYNGVVFAAASSADQRTPIMPGSQTLSMTVQVVYSI